MSATMLRVRLRAATGGPEARLQLADRLAERGSAIQAARHIAAAARDGMPEAQARLGICYLRGYGVPPNQSEARHWLERAADAGDATAQTELASLALRGVSGPFQRGTFSERNEVSGLPNYSVAADLARRAAKAGSAEARALLGYILSLTPSMAETPDEADGLYRDSAKAGSPLGKFGYALTLLREGTPEATTEARELLSDAADAGLPSAHFLFGAMAESGMGGAQDPETAVTHYRTAAEQGHNGAKTRLGLALMSGRGTKRSLVEAETWLRRAASDGDAVAAAVLGDFHASSEWQPANLEAAAHWYRHAAELGHPASARVLARAISAGAEGKPDLQEIVAWLRTAIERGDSSAWADLGDVIASSRLPPEQLSVMHGWLQQMIQEQHPEAGYYVGVCVNCGIGTPTDEVLARRYYLWAAGEGVIEAMVAAGEMLLDGRGGRADPTVARTLFQYAAKQGHPGAHYALGVIASQDQSSAMKHFERAAALGHTKAKMLTEGGPITA